MSGVPRGKLIADIGHDLKHSISNEISKIRSGLKVQQEDFQDQLEKMTREAKVAVDERDQVREHLHVLRSEVR